MEPDALEPARSRYNAAYAAYVDCARRVAQKLKTGLTPSADEMMEEAKATEQLALARRELLDAISKLLDELATMFPRPS
jgi:hypothetical protein